MKILSGHQSNYLPYPGLFYKIARSDGFIFVDHVQFERKSWQNRNRIRVKDSWNYLTVPVLKKGKLEQSILNVEIDDCTNWRDKHLQSIWLHYHKAPYYHEISTFIEGYYSVTWTNIVNLNREFTLYVLKKLYIDTPIYYSENYNIETKKTDMLIELCEKLKFDAYLSNEGSRAYVDESKFQTKKIKHEYCNYSTPAYMQQYANFEADLSIIDMISNIGFLKTRQMILE